MINQSLRPSYLRISFGQANGLAERRMEDNMKHLRDLVFASDYLPLAQHIINYSVNGPIGTQPARVTL